MSQPNDPDVVILERWTGPVAAGDPHANFKREVVAGALVDPLPTLRNLASFVGLPVGAVCRHALVRWPRRSRSLRARPSRASAATTAPTAATMGHAFVSVPETVLLSGEASAPSRSRWSTAGSAPLTVTHGMVTDPSTAAAPTSMRI